MSEIQYTYVPLRYVHDMTTREFVNVGVVVHSASARFVGAMCAVTFPRVLAMFPNVDPGHLQHMLSHIQAQVEILNSRVKLDPQGKSFRRIEELVTSVLPRDESSLQWGEAGAGITDDPRKALAKLFERLVTKYESRVAGASTHVVSDSTTAFVLMDSHKSWTKARLLRTGGGMYPERITGGGAIAAGCLVVSRSAMKGDHARALENHSNKLGDVVSG
ncbi:hypothetical protein DSM104443_01786 [Usitatibacter rugosus]|uniref:DUF3037 family protein n=1 Tax=Usitatibacter rugosus TaxID=2732067 RepID=A0A6M4GYX0_9PROT|nr:DUF3037 domain-containing protein [Usitatibacter rugosus]QJR10717.1 hypothetical protein DSM104443_01786 [Usitatibacter rugosus]